ncbi:MAG TPA: DUF2332 domain-containing protein [Nocardioidaceae bacterium]
MELYVDVAGQYRDFADYARGDSPCFEEWALRVADDPDVLAWIGDLPPAKQQPNLVFAAARRHGVRAPGPYDGLRTALLTDDGTIRSTILERSTQTNEVGRLATITPVLAGIQQASGRPLALVEAGASAGLCLLPDRVGYEWRTDRGTFRALPDRGSPLTLPCDVTGHAPLPEAVPEVAWRRGVDLNPLDVRDDAAMAWLTNLVWPEQHERRARLVTAIDLARADPPTLVRGNLLDELPALVEEAREHGEVVVFHSAVIAYLSPQERDRFQQLMADLVGRGGCHWVSNEGPQVLPSVAVPGRAPAGMFVLGVDGRAVAWAHGHGRALSWL